MPSLLVASSGGHLAQLELLSRRMQLPEPYTWVTFENSQSSSLLQGKNVRFAPFAGTRDIGGTWKAFRFAQEIFKEQSFDVVVSTGASIAVAFLPLAARQGSKAYYIESATRFDGPSLTGRILQFDPRIQLRTQYAHWGNRANKRWKYGGCIFDGFISEKTEKLEIKRIVVSVGMHKDFGFPRLIEHLINIIPEGVEVVWQTGATDVSKLPIKAVENMTAAELSTEIKTADVVITHAGMGSAISCLEAGKRAVFVPRRAEYNEHVDDHQVAIASHLDTRRLVAMAEAHKLSWQDIEEAARWQILQNNSPFSLE